jgi:hypothetical protein
MFQIRRLASRDNPADDEGFERRKAAYQAFVEKRTVDLGTTGPMMRFFERRKAAYQAFVEKQAGPPENLTLLSCSWVLAPADNGTSLNSGFRY